jgi:hypothetical protein
MIDPRAHLDQALRAVGGDLQERLADTDRFHWDCSIELRAVGTAFAHGREPLLRCVWCTASKVNEAVFRKPRPPQERLALLPWPTPDSMSMNSLPDHMAQSSLACQITTQQAKQP